MNKSTATVVKSEATPEDCPHDSVATDKISVAAREFMDSLWEKFGVGCLAIQVVYDVDCPDRENSRHVESVWDVVNDLHAAAPWVKQQLEENREKMFKVIEEQQS